MNKASKEPIKSNFTRFKSFVKRIFDTVEGVIIGLFQWFSSWVDRLLFNEKYARLIALLLAVMLYMVMNFGGSGLLESTSRALSLLDVPVTTNADEDVFEIKGLPKTVDVTLFGDEADIQAARNQGNYKVVADFTGKNDGEYTVELTPQNFSSRVKVTVEPATATVTVRKKETGKFNITAEYMNENKLDSMYALGEAEFEIKEALVRASNETLDSIAFIKALIDVSNQQGHFEAEAPLVAYNHKGEKLDVDIMPRIVKVKVPIKTLSKSVPLVVVPKGKIPEGFAIESVHLSTPELKVYGSADTLADLEKISVPIDASKIMGDVTVFNENIVIPEGVKTFDADTIVIEVIRGKRRSKLIKDVPIEILNLGKDLDLAEISDQELKTDIRVFGSKKVLDNIKASNIGRVYIDLEGLKEGHYEPKVKFEATSFLANYNVSKKSIELEVIKPS